MSSRMGGRQLKVERNLRDKPNKCLICHHHIDPKEVASQMWSTGDMDYDDRMDVAYICPRNECGRLFYCVFESVSSSKRGEALTAVNYEFCEAIPRVPAEPQHSSEILEISNSFVELFRQAAFAEAYDLGDIAGGAYRKALEFLIKDYCISKFPDSEGEIKQKLLGRVIGDYVEDPNVKKCAERAAWLGNDETHYERRWVDRDIDDLKTLIRLTSNWIINEVLTEQYVEEMQS